MPYSSTHHFIANTLGLQAYLEDNARDRTIIPEAIRLAGRFPEKLRDGHYGLMSDAQLAPDEVEGVMRRLFPGHPADVVYVGIEDLERSAEEQMRVYRLVLKGRTLSALIAAQYQPCDPRKSKEARELLERVKLALGTHKLRKVLDRSFGHDFSKILKDNIVAVWHYYFCAVMKVSPGGTEAEDARHIGAVEHLGRLCALTTKTLPVALVGEAGGKRSWLFFVQRNDAKALS